MIFYQAFLKWSKHVDLHEFLGIKRLSHLTHFDERRLNNHHGVRINYDISWLLENPFMYDTYGI